GTRHPRSGGSSRTTDDDTSHPPDPTARFDAVTTPAGPVPARRAITPATAPKPRRTSRASTTPVAPESRPAAVYSARHAAAPSATQMFGFGSPYATGMEAR
ncbi:hypothetical protein BKH30_06340, partial [Actinomyces oris]